MSATRPLIAIDWGTSALRGARLGASGQVLELREFPRGILTEPPGGFEAVFHALFGDWLQAPGALCLISGMAGSRQGWQEAPYRPCPAGFAKLGQYSILGKTMDLNSTFNEAVFCKAQSKATEAFAALDAGAHGLKLLPAEMISPATVKAMRAVLPKTAALMPVGGITPDNMAAYRSAGASGFGLGSALYAPGRSAAQVQEMAQAFVRAWQFSS